MRFYNTRGGGVEIRPVSVQIYQEYFLSRISLNMRTTGNDQIIVSTGDGIRKKRFLETCMVVAVPIITQLFFPIPKLLHSNYRLFDIKTPFLSLCNGDICWYLKKVDITWSSEHSIPSVRHRLRHPRSSIIAYHQLVLQKPQFVQKKG